VADALHTGEAGASATDDRVPPSDGCAAAGLLYSIPVRQGWRYMCSHGSYAAALHTGEAGVGAVGDHVPLSNVCAAAWLPHSKLCDTGNTTIQHTSDRECDGGGSRPAALHTGEAGVGATGALVAAGQPHSTPEQADRFTKPARCSFSISSSIRHVQAYKYPLVRCPGIPYNYINSE
jgi:hypothetical protein